MDIILIIVVIQAIICAALSSSLAEHKGYDTFSWGVVGFLFGIIGLIATAGLPVKRRDEYANQMIKECPDCSENILISAIICKYCGKKFSNEDVINDLAYKLKTNKNYNKGVSLMKMLRKKNHMSSIPVLLELLNSSNLKEEAIESLIEFGDKVIPHLEKFGEEGTKSDKKLAFNIIKKIKESRETE